MTLYKRDHFLFLFVFFSRNKAVRVDYFDFNVCLVMLFFFYYYCFRTVQDSSHDVLWLQQYIGHNGLDRTRAVRGFCHLDCL